MEIEEISRPMKTSSSSTAEVMSSMPTAPKRMRAKNSPRSCGVRRHGVERDEQRSENDAADEDVEEDAEGIGLDDAEVGGAGRELKLPEAGGESGEHAKHG